GDIPLYREFLRHARIPARQFVRLFGSAAYSKLQKAAGDELTKLPFKRTPLATIMRQYGALVIEVGDLPPYSDWEHRGLNPSEAGLRQKPHNLKWSEMPGKFVEWIESNGVSGFEKAIGIITASSRPATLTRDNGD